MTVALRNIAIIGAKDGEGVLFKHTFLKLLCR